MNAVLTATLITCGALIWAGPGRPAIHQLKDGTLLEGQARKTATGWRITTPFGVREISADAYQGPAQVSLQTLQRQYRDMRSGMRRSNRSEHVAMGTWCLKKGYLSGLRRELNVLLAREIDDPWARKQVAAQARVNLVDRTERPRYNRDRRKFVDFLFEVLAVRDNVGAVMATEKARTLPRELTFRPAMKAMRKGFKPRTRWAGALVLGLHDDQPTRISPLYKQSLKDGIWAVRREAVRALKATADPVFVKLFAKHLKSPKALLRVRAAQALAELADSAALRPLLAALQDTFRPVRTYIAVLRQIAYVKDYDVEVAQTAFIADPVVDVIQDGAVLELALVSVTAERRIYRDALRRLTGANLGADPAAWRKWLAGHGQLPR